MGNTDVRAPIPRCHQCIRAFDVRALGMGCLCCRRVGLQQVRGSSQRDATTDAVMLLGGTAVHEPCGGPEAPRFWRNTGTAWAATPGFDASAGGVGGLGGLPGSRGRSVGREHVGSGTTATGGNSRQRVEIAAQRWHVERCGDAGHWWHRLHSGPRVPENHHSRCSRGCQPTDHDAGIPSVRYALWNRPVLFANSPCHQCMPSPDKCLIACVWNRRMAEAFDPTLPTALRLFRPTPLSAGVRHDTHSIHFYQCIAPA